MKRKLFEAQADRSFKEKILCSCGQVGKVMDEKKIPALDNWVYELSRDQ